jgi:REP-associated tyrosine transposase
VTRNLPHEECGRLPMQNPCSPDLSLPRRPIRPASGGAGPRIPDLDAMPRFSRPMPGGFCVHVVTRGNARATVFHCDADFATMTRLMMDAQAVVRVELLAWCLMPNHVHLVIRPAADGDLARWMHWLLTTHVQQHRVRHRTTGRIWQGRYKAFPIQTDRHLLTVLRYVERNPVRAALTSHAIEWKWSSARERPRAGRPRCLLAESPVPLPSPWLDWVDTPLTDAELLAIRACATRGRPLGDPSWTHNVAARLHLSGTLRPRGRPRVGDRPLNSEADGDRPMSS